MHGNEFARRFHHQRGRSVPGRDWVALHGNWCNETVTAPWNCLDKARIFGIVVDDRAKFLQDYVETAVEVDISAFWPKPLAEFIAADDLSRALQQRHKHAKRLLLNFDAHAIARQRAASSISLKKAKSED